MSTMTASTTLRPTMVRTPAPAGATVRTPVRAPQGQVRLTRRGRVIVFSLALLLVLGLGLLLANGSVATEKPGTPEPTRVVMVGSGDTLWDIAASIADDGDVRAMVDHIRDLNALDTAMIEAGQRLRVPLQD